MTTNQLRTFLDAHGVPGAPTEAGEPSEVFYCEHTSDHGSAHVGHEFYTRRELAILCAGNAPLIIVRHAPLPDPTALQDKLAAADAHAEALRHRVRELEGRKAEMCGCVHAEIDDSGSGGPYPWYAAVTDECPECGGSGAVLVSP